MSDAPRDVTRILRQHALTTQLLGVDFLPMGAEPDLAGLVLDAGSGEPNPSATPDHAAQTTPPSQAAAAAGPALPTGSVEPKPRQAKRAPAAAMGLPKGELDREAKQGLLADIKARYEAERPHEPFIMEYTNLVFGEGDPDARLMFVGEAPGEQEDLTGKPFVGRSGELLEKMIIAMGLSRETVYIANVLKVRPPNNQTPTAEEAEASAPFLFDQIRVVQPEVIVTLGLPASRLLLGTSEPMRSMRGAFRTFPSGTGQGIFGGFEQGWSGEPIPVMPTYHPAYLLRSYTPENRKKVWGDLCQVMDKLGLDAKA